VGEVACEPASTPSAVGLEQTARSLAEMVAEISAWLRYGPPADECGSAKEGLGEPKELLDRIRTCADLCWEWQEILQVPASCRQRLDVTPMLCYTERTALWESIGAWEELVRTWLSVPLSDLDKEQVLPSWCHAACIEHANRTDRSRCFGSDRRRLLTARTSAPFSCA
jgi:hypothetical protein